MPFSKSTRPVRSPACSLGLMLTLLAGNSTAWGQEAQLSQPVYRAAGEAQPAQPAAAAPVAAPNPQMPFNLTQQPDEHPLMPFIRVAEQSLQLIDQNVNDYSCTFVKQERIGGELADQQQIFLKVLHQPFSVYMAFLQPFAGREVAYIQGQNNNELVVLEGGWKRKMLGKMHLDPQGMVAMRGQKHPITKVGIRNLLAEAIQTAKAETQFAECEVTVHPNQQVAGRPATLVQIVHPVPRQNFRANITRMFFDNELKVPIHYDVFLWPEQPGAQPPLDGSYTYMNLKVNNRFTPLDFDSEKNPQIFQANGAPAVNQVGGRPAPANQLGAAAAQNR